MNNTRAAIPGLYAILMVASVFVLAACAAHPQTIQGMNDGPPT